MLSEIRGELSDLISDNGGDYGGIVSVTDTNIPLVPFEFDTPTDRGGGGGVFGSPGLFDTPADPEYQDRVEVE